MIPHSRPTIKKKDLESALHVMVSDKLATGDVIYEFERAFASQFGKTYSAIFVTSGTTALTLLFHYLGIQEGDEVILSSFLNASPLQVITAFKAKPVFVDITEDSYNMDMDLVLERITEKTRAIIVSHMFGSAAHIDELVDVKVPVIEDCGHALGAMFNGQPLGGFGDYAYVSLSATRMITSGGAGGMVVTKKKGVIDTLRDLRYYDKKDDFTLRFNMFPTDLQAAIGLAELKNLPQMIRIREAIAEIYNTALMQTDAATKRTFHEGEVTNNYRYVIELEGAQTVTEAVDMFARHEIEAARPVYKPLYNYFDLPREEYPNAEKAYLSAISVPIYPSLLRKDVDTIEKLIRRIR